MKLDHVGSGMAVLCAIHCLALPVLAGGSLLGGALLEHPAVEIGMLGFTAVVGYSVLGSSFRLHRHPLPLALLTAGLAALVLADSLEGIAGTVSTVAGAVIVVVAQWINRRLHGGGCFADCCDPECMTTTEPLRLPAS